MHDALYEMNRRLRRRMVTRGEVSLDVEDNLGPYDWPQVKELTSDMLKYSVHFPLIPCVSPDFDYNPCFSKKTGD